MEYWDAYLSDGTKTGDVLVRGEPIPNGLHHLVCEVLVRHADGDFLLMRRALDKKGYPGFFEASAGGSALMGEDAPTAARRELFEETGLRAELFTEIAHAVEGHCIYYSYVCTVDTPKDSIILQEGETVDYRWLNREAFLEFTKSTDMIPFQKRHFAAYFKTL